MTCAMTWLAGCVAGAEAGRLVGAASATVEIDTAVIIALCRMLRVGFTGPVRL